LPDRQSIHDYQHSKNQYCYIPKVYSKTALVYTVANLRSHVHNKSPFFIIHISIFDRHFPRTPHSETFRALSFDTVPPTVTLTVPYFNESDGYRGYTPKFPGITEPLSLHQHVDAVSRSAHSRTQFLATKVEEVRG